MRRIVPLIALALPLLAADSPNVVLILADDQGWTETSLQMHDGVPDSKSDYYRAPALERLATEGTGFRPSKD
jgi:arylsulfatase A-like enzyme